MREYGSLYFIISYLWCHLSGLLLIIICRTRHYLDAGYDPGDFIVLSMLEFLYYHLQFGLLQKPSELVEAYGTVLHCFGGVHVFHSKVLEAQRDFSAAGIIVIFQILFRHVYSCDGL